MSALDPAFLGLGRPSSLTSDSPFAIADAARRDTTTPSAPKTVQPKPRQPPPQQQQQQVGGYQQQGQGYRSPPPQQQQQGYAPPQQGYQPHGQRPGMQSAPSSSSLPAGGSGGRPYAPAHAAPPQQYQQHPQQSYAPQQAQAYHPQPPSSQSQGYMPPPTNPARPTQSPHPPHAAPPGPGRYPSSAPSTSYQSPTPGPGGGYAAPPAQYQQPPAQSSAQAYAQGHGAPGGYAQGQGQGQPGARTSRDRPMGEPQSAPAPPLLNPDEELRQLFADTNISRSGQLSAKEVQALLSQDARTLARRDRDRDGGRERRGPGGVGGIGGIEAREDCVKMLMNIFDTDRSGTINFSEFEGLYRYIKDWHAIFMRFDRDGSGTIDRHELEQALQSFGFPLPPDLVRKLEKRFAPPKGDANAPRGITFDRFLMACVTVKHFSEAFRKRDVRSEGRLTLDYNSFMELVIEAPS